MSEYYENLVIKKLALMAELNDPIDPQLYNTYDVKRGLRYSDGRGVLVGLTQVGDVIGYDVVDGKKVAVPGKLLYRGYDVEALIHDADSHDEFGFEQPEINRFIKLFNSRAECLVKDYVSWKDIQQTMAEETGIWIPMPKGFDAE